MAKFKITRFALIALIIFSTFFGTICIAAGDYAIDPDTKSTPSKQCFVTITKPTLKEQRSDIPFYSYSDTYLICGVTDDEDVKITLRVYNLDKDIYDRYKDTREEDGTPSSWKIGASGIFAKEIQLSEGENKFRIIATKKSEGVRISQITNFTIYRLNESDIIEKIKIGIQSILDLSPKQENDQFLTS